MWKDTGKKDFSKMVGSHLQLLAVDPTEYPVIGVKSWQPCGSQPNEHLIEVYNGGDPFNERTVAKKDTALTLVSTPHYGMDQTTHGGQMQLMLSLFSFIIYHI